MKRFNERARSKEAVKIERCGARGWKFWKMGNHKERDEEDVLLLALTGVLW